MESLARGGFTAEEVKWALHAPNRRIRFRYNLLDSDDNFIRELRNVTNGVVSLRAGADIKRTAQFELKEEKGISIDYLNDRIQPAFELQMTKKVVNSVTWDEIGSKKWSEL